MHIQNDVSTTFFGSRGISTHYIIVSSGIVESKPLYWQTISDNLGSPHN